MEEIEGPIPIDTSVEDWIKEIELMVEENKKRHDAREKVEIENKTKESPIELKFMKEILKMKKFCEMKCSF